MEGQTSMWLPESNSGHLAVSHLRTSSGNLSNQSEYYHKNRWFNCKLRLLDSAQVVFECATLVGFCFLLPSCCAQELVPEGSITHSGSFWRMGRQLLDEMLQCSSPSMWRNRWLWKRVTRNLVRDTQIPLHRHISVGKDSFCDLRTTYIFNEL